MIIQNLPNESMAATVEACLKELAGCLALQSERIFNDLVLRRQVLKEFTPRGGETNCEWESTGCFYGRPIQRMRPFYTGRDNEKKRKNGEKICEKYYETYKKNKLSGGLMALWIS